MGTPEQNEKAAELAIYINEGNANFHGKLDSVEINEDGYGFIVINISKRVNSGVNTHTLTKKFGWIKHIINVRATNNLLSIQFEVK